MYYDYFGLYKAPFQITPNTEMFYPGAQRMEILRGLSYAVRHGEGIIKVVGEVGSGKTMLSRMLAAEIEDDVELVYLLDPGLTPHDVHRAIAQELGIDIQQQTDRVSILQALHHKLLERYGDKKHVVVFIDEAQNMPLETLEEIRLLSNLETNTRKLLQIVLFGQPELDKKLSTTQARQLRERITENFHLPLLSAEQTGQYLSHRLNNSGYKSSAILFNWKTTRLIARASQGSLRKINTLADKSLLCSYATRKKIVTKKHVRAAIKDSQMRQPAISNWQLITSVLATFITIPTVAMALLAPNTPNITTVDTDQPLLIPEKAIVNEETPTLAKINESFTEKTKHVLSTSLPGKKENTSKTDQPTKQTIKNWVDSNQSRFTIQLFSTKKDNDRSINTFLKANEIHLNNENIRVLPSQYNANDRINIVYGSYNTKKEARAAIASLPDSILRNQPYLRSISRITPIANKN